MNTAKALIAGIVVTVALLASSFVFEGVAQVLGPEEEEHVDDEHAEEDEHAEDEDGDDEHAEDEADEVDLDGEDDEDHAE